jgi:DNA replication protein DnaC
MTPSLTLTRDDVDDPYVLEDNLDRGRQTLDRIPTRYRQAALTHPQVAAWATKLVTLARDTRPVPRIAHGPSLLVLGPTGTGKTHTAYAAVAALAQSGAACSWLALTAADMYAQLRPRHGVDSEQVFDTLTRVSLLVIDDLGAAKGTEWNEEINYRLINHRYEHEQPTLVTSNVPPANLAHALGERVASRLTEMADRVVLKGADRRLAS